MTALGPSGWPCEGSQHQQSTTHIHDVCSGRVTNMVWRGSCYWTNDARSNDQMMRGILRHANPLWRDHRSTNARLLDLGNQK